MMRNLLWRLTHNKKFLSPVKISLIALFLIMLVGIKAEAQVSVTLASGETNISADKAANSTSPGFTTLGPITILEGGKKNLKDGTFIFNAPTGWSFQQSGIYFTASTWITATISYTPTVITLTISGLSNGAAETFEIGGVAVRANDGANITSAGNITFNTLSTADNAGSGLSNTTNLGSLSQMIGAMSKLVVTLPGETFTDGSTVAGSGNTGTVTNQTVGTAFNLSKITATDQFFNVITTYTGSKTITYSGPGNGATSPTYTTSVNFTSGVSTTILATTLTKAETTTISVSDGINSGPPSSNLTVNLGAVGVLDHFSISTITSPQTAGTAITGITLTAQDVNNNTVTGFTGTVVYSGTAGITGTSASFTSGVLTGVSVTPVTAGTGMTFIVTGSTKSGSISFDVNRATATVTLGNLSQTYDGTAKSATATTTPAGLTVDFTYDGSPMAPTAAGSYAVVVTINDSNYQGSASGTLVIGKATATVTLGNLSQTYDGTAKSATATTTPSGLTVDLTYNGSSTAPTAAGSYAVVGTINDSNYQGSASGTLVIGKATPTISVSGAQSFTYNGSSQGPATITYNGDGTTSLLYTNTSGAAYSSATAPTNAGSYKVVASAAAGINYLASTSADYTFTVTAKAIAVLADVGQSKVYGGTDPTFAYTPSEALAVGNSWSGALARTAGENFGTYAYNIGTLSAGTNYSVTLTGTNTFAITAKSITVSADAGQSKVYGGTDPTFAYSSSEALAAGNSWSGALARTVGENFGTYAYNIGTLSAGSNYNVTLTGTNTFAIAAKTVTITPTTGQSKVYGETDPTFTFANSESLATGSFTGSLSRSTGENVSASPYPYALGTLSAGTNYTLVLGGSSTFAITEATLTYNANVASKTYGDANPSFSGSVLGFATGDNLENSTTGTLAFSSATTATSGVGSYAITGSGLTANNGNYTFVQAANNATALTIGQRSLNFTGTRGYDGSVTFTAAQLTAGNIVNSDVVTLGGSGTVSTKDIATYTSFSTNTLTSSNANYKVTGGTVNVSITAAVLTYTANAASKTYGDANPSFSGTITGFASGDNQSNATTGTLSFSSLATATSVVGSYAITGSGLTANNGNYSFAQAAENTTALTINKATLTITAEPKSKCYDESIYSDGYTVIYSGFVNSETSLVLGGTLTFSGTAIAGILAGSYTIIPAGLTSSNYDITFQNGTLTIHPRPEIGSFN